MAKISDYYNTNPITNADPDGLLLIDAYPITSTSTGAIKVSDLMSSAPSGSIPESSVTNLVSDLAGKYSPSNLPPGSSPATFTTNGTVKQTVYNVRDYGAVGDGTTDDYVAINAAITAAASGGIVLLHPGTYAISHPILMLANVILRGSGQTTTTIKLLAAGLANFNLDFMISYASGVSDCIVSDLSLDGNYASLTAPPANQGGLMQVYAGWLVERVEFKSSNYFKLWVNGSGTTDVVVRNCIWTGTVGAGNDNIGGGAFCSNINIEGCRWVSGLNGNPIDLTNASYIKFIRNYNYSANTAYFE